MFDWFLFYCILTPLSFLPLWILYRLSDVTYVILFYFVKYRRKVTHKNLTTAYPHKTPQEIRSIEKKYYKHLADLLAESIYGISATPKEILRHYKIVNRGLVDKYYEEGRSVILMSAHYNNWEYMVLSLNFQLRHHGVGVGKPLDNKNFDAYLTKTRTHYGDEVVDQRNVRQVMEYYHHYQVPVAYMMLSDQSPSNARKSFWTRFMNQDTAFLYGGEYFARKYDYSVLFYEVHKIKRGNYEVTFSELCPHADQIPEGMITQTYVQKLEELINRQPEYWLWSHRRWKLKKDGTRNV